MRGKDKLLETVDATPLLRVQALRALATQQPVFVAISDHQEERKAVLSGLDVTILTVHNASEGMSGTLRDAVAQLPDADAFMVMLGDLVGIKTTDLQKVLDARQHHRDYLIWRGATDSSEPGHPIIFDASLRPLFADISGDNGAEMVVKSLRNQVFLVPLDGRRARLDLDTPEEWEAWRNSSDIT
ncbi:CTP:molybdopterin cytidylyltransferase MocA [Yoonia sediminilitoris]|uniref:CTP:molybdopterin cytidylyltransferase MocA n=2 Tax=Yoonia sediminilitoris TaxID=1286148 RepID=A0A2T6KD04_9RHOB|nr:CTP:molybdopterin cytidylyltransferase MocA [Yoonia sediminilitoris]RCW94289.1 CTP:molybdopterin cytidylyltransferase MocA [Yoonia sediminilitoris]